MLKINDCIFLREDELLFRASRSAGPGGQNVNKVNTRINLHFDVANSKSLTGWQKHRIISALSGRIDKTGTLRIVSQKFRTQQANRSAAVEKLQQLLSQALKEKTARHKTTIPYSAKQNRLKHKRKRSLKKQLRTEKDFESS
jgi:ribosome-associated protein